MNRHMQDTDLHGSGVPIDAAIKLPVGLKIHGPGFRLTTLKE